MKRKSTFKRAWDKLMAKETTTTFTVTVKHQGDKRGFDDLFRSKGRKVIEVKSTLEITDTKKVPPKSRYSNEQKMVRLFIKEACEAAGLTYSNYPEHKHTYGIEYGWCSKGGRADFLIRLYHIRINLDFENGVDAKGNMEVWDQKNPQTDPKPLNNHWQRAQPIPNLNVDFHLAAPDAKEQLIAHFETWGKKYEEV